MAEAKAAKSAPGAVPECDATIAICTYNRISTLPRTLRALESLRGPYNFEVLVVNGPSDDGTTEFLAGCDDIRLLDNPQTNLAVSRNIAIANAAGRYIAFIDDDAVPEPDWLTLILERMEAEPDLAAMGGFIRDANGITFQDKYVYADIFGTGHPCDNPDYATFLRREKRLYLSLTGTNVVFRRAPLVEIGGFDEVFAYFLDETDVNKRMDDAGLRAEVLPAAEIHHKFAPSHLRTEKKVAKNMHPIARSIAYFAMVHGIPELGWQAASERVKSFYRAELNWKSQMLAQGDIDTERFDELMFQTGQGLIEGIDCYFDRADAGDPRARVQAHERPGTPVIRRMRDAAQALRLCMFSQDHAHPRLGGIGRWTNLVARGLAERGHEVTVVGELPGGAAHEYCDFTEHGFWSHNVGHFPREAGNEVDCLGLPPSLANASKRKLSELRRVAPRRHFQLASSPIWDVEGAAVIGSGAVPTVLSLHTCAGLMLESKPEWRDNERYYNNHVLRVINAEIQALRRCSLILANSHAIMRDISGLYGLDLFERPHVVIPHGLEDIAAPEGLLDARIARRAHSVVQPAAAAPPPQMADSPLRVLFLGRLETRKGVAHMAAVLDRLLEAGQPLAVDIVGARVDDTNFARVSGLAEKYPGQITLHGFLEEAALDALMRRTDIFFAPSLYESFGLIYIEAMRYAVPSVAYATGGVPEVITDGEDGLLAPAGDSRALHDALERMITDDDLRHRLSRAARRSFEEKFGYALMAERLEEAYRGVAAGKRDTA